jgi:hypothetical protein
VRRNVVRTIGKRTVLARSGPTSGVKAARDSSSVCISEIGTSTAIADVALAAVG